MNKQQIIIKNANTYQSLVSVRPLRIALKVKDTDGPWWILLLLLLLLLIL